MSSFLYSHDGLVVLLQLAAALVCFGLAFRATRGAWSEIALGTRVSFGLLALGAVLLSVLAFPTERYDAVGHEASYFECFRGQQSPANALVEEPGEDPMPRWHSYVTYPMLRWSYWAVGAVVGRDSGPGPLLLLNALATGLGVLLFGWFVREFTGSDRSGIFGALLLAVHPVHAFWGAAIFHTAIPHALAVGCLLFSLLAWRRGDARLFVVAALCGCLVATTRVEWGLLAPSLAVLLVGLGPDWGRSPGVKRLGFWWPALVLTLIWGFVLVASAGPLTQQGGYHGVGGYLATIGRQAGFLEVFAPWNERWMLAASIGGAAWWVFRSPPRWRPVLGVLGFILVGHLGLATFNDYGYRHALLPGLGLLLLASLLVDTLGVEVHFFRGLGAAFLAGVVTTSVLGLSEASQRYYVQEESFFDDHPGFAAGRQFTAEELESGECYLVTDNERLWELSRARSAEQPGQDVMVGSHFNLMDPGEAVRHYREHHGCVRWLYDWSQYRWDSLGPRVRAAKMQYWFRFEQEGWARFPDGMDAVVYQLREAPWGVAGNAPLPPTEFRLPGLDDPGADSELESPP